MGTISTTIKINDAFSNPLDKLSSGLARAQSGMSRMKSALAGNMFGNAERSSGNMFKTMAGGVAVGNLISKGMGMAGAGVKSMIGELNEASTSWQTFEGNLRQIGQSPAQIANAKKEMQQFAQQTIYSASDMSTTYSQLAAVGTKNTAQLVKGFGGLAATAADPAQAMKTISEQATQMAAKPKVQWQDFKLMMEQAPAGMSAVAKSMGTDLTGLIQKIQDGKVKTQDFLDAVAKTGTNKNFSKMATQYKTVGQAMDGLKETLANKLQPEFDKVGKVGIKAVKQITDRLGKLNFKRIGDDVANLLGKVDVNKVMDGIGNAFNTVLPIIKNISRVVGDIFKGFQSTPAIGAIGKAFSDIGRAISNVTSKIRGFQGGNLFSNLGQLVGNGISTVAGIITNIANAIGRMSPGQIKAVGVAIASFAGSLALLKGMGSVSGSIMNIARGFKEFKGGWATSLKGIKQIPQAFSGIGKMGNDVAGFFSILKDGANSAKAIKLPAFLGGNTQIGAGIGGLAGKISGIVSSIGQLAPALSGAFLPISGIVLGVTAVIAGAVMAWKSNFMGFRDFVQSTFSGFGQAISQAFSGLSQAFAPIRQAFGQIGQAIQPALPAIKTFITALGAIVGTGVLVGLAMIVDIFKNIVSGIGAAFSALKGFVQGLHGVGDAIKDIAHGDFSFSSARKTFADAGKAFGDAQKNFHPLDFSVTKKTIGNAINAATSAAGKKKVKVGIDVDPMSANKKISSIAKGSKYKVKIGTKVDIAETNKKLAALSNKKIKAPKVATPKVPTPKTPHLKQIPAPKVGTPKVPTPKTPHLKTIPAPKVARPNMSGVVSAVSSGMARAAAAARAGGVALSSAVRSAVNQAAAAGRAAAGQMQSVGAMIGQGLAAGIRSQVGAVAAAADALVAQANRAARAKAQIHSPSRLFAEVGSFIGQGMAVGMNSTLGLINQSSEAMINSAYPSVGTNGVRSNSIASSNAVGSSLITPNSATNTTNYYGNGTTSTSQITIAPGAIVINDSSSPEETANSVLTQIEDLIFNQKDKALG